jgi:murein DD-endopeptidase MepM/ murein hydrolase activator NlpD
MNYPGYADYGAKILAWRQGFVRAFDYGYDHSYGRGVAINHGDAVSVYAHMSQVLANVIGQIVSAGTPVGLVGDYGNTGSPPTSHLHFEQRGPGDLHQAGGGPKLPKFPGWLVDIAKNPLGYVKGLIDGPIDNFRDKFNGPVFDIFAAVPGKLVDGVKDKIVDILPDGILRGASKGADIVDSVTLTPDEVFARGGILPYNGAMKYDSGGFLPPGLTSVVNLTGKPEPVFTNDQFSEMGTGGGGITYAPVITEANLTSEELMDDFEFTMRKLGRRGGKYEGVL